MSKESHGQRSLAGYSPWEHKESDMTEQLIPPSTFYKIYKAIKTLTLLCMSFHEQGLEKHLSQVVHDLCELEKVTEESKEVFSNTGMLNEKLKLDLQEIDFTEFLAVHHEKLTNENLMKLDAQIKDKERQEQEEVTEELNRFTMQETAKGLSLFEEALFIFEAQDLNVE